MSNTFTEMLLSAQKKNSSCVCVGIDPDREKILTSDVNTSQVAEGMLREFCERIVTATAPMACVFKLNFGFFLNFVDKDPAAGIEVLRAVIGLIGSNYPDIPVILDYKANDIGNSAKQYAESAFLGFGADAVTINPYMGIDSVGEFLKLGFAFVLCKTSNKSSGDFQDLSVKDPAPAVSVFQKVAQSTADWRKLYFEGGGIVFGATYPAQLKEICDKYPDMPMLIPGIGKQGGALEDTIGAVARETASQRIFVVNSSRGIIYADSPANATDELRLSINDLLPDKFYG